MNEAVAVAVLWVALVGGVAALVARRMSVAPPSRRWTALETRAGAAADQSVRSLGRPLTAAIFLGAGMAFTIATCWILGRFAKALEGTLDRPAFTYFEGHHVGWLSGASRLLTQMGNGLPTRMIALLAAIAFAVLWRRARWWAPPVALVVGFAMERFGAELLRLVVHRGHPPTTLGTWPSGGCARLILVYGLVVFLYQRWRGRGVGREAAWAWAGLAVLAAVEAFTRVYLLKHWLTDAAGGLVFGTLLLVTMMGTFALLDWTLQTPTDRTTAPALEELTRLPATAGE